MIGNKIKAKYYICKNHHTDGFCFLQQLYFMKKIFSLVLFVIFSVSAKSQSITITQPNGGEKLYACDAYTIRFTASGTSTYYNIDYSLNNGATWVSSATNLLITNGQYVWTVPYVNSDSCLLRVYDKNNSSVFDVSNNIFSIKIPITVVAPNGGENVIANTPYTIKWNATSVSGSYNIYYSIDNGSTWATVISNYATTAKTYSWTPPNQATVTTCRIRVTDNDTLCKYDISDANFTITEATPKMTYPNGGEIFNWGDGYTITWNKATYYSPVRIDYSTDSGTTWQNYTTSSTNNGSLNAQIPWVTSTKCLVKVSNTANLNSYDISDATFTIKVPVTLTTPNGGQVLKGCNSQLINFYAPPNINTYYSLYYTIDGGATYNNITTLSYSSSGSYSYSWSIPNSINSTQCKIKVESYSYASYLADSSDTYFTINPSNAITVTYPNGGEQIQSLTNKTITWTADATTSGSYSVYYSANGGVSYTTLISNTTAKSYVWTNIPNNPGTNYLIRVLDYNNSCKYDESDATFTVLEATPKMTYPNGGEIFNWGDGYTITWNKATYYSAVRIDYSTDSGTTWQNYTTSSTNNGSLNAQIPWVTSTKCLVKVSNTANLNSYDISDATFTIKVPVTLTTPNGGQVLKGCNSQLINFYAPPNINTYYSLYYTIDGGATYNNITTLSYSSSGSYSYSWSIPNSINSTQCKIKVESYSYASYLADSSDTYFTINPSNAITVTYPNGGEQIQSLTNKTITWTADATTSGSYSVYYSANGGVSYTTLISNTTAKSYVWTNIPNNPGTNYLIRVLDYNNSCKYDESDATFTVLEATPKMTYPNGGEIFNWGDGYTITWNKATYYSAVRIDYSTDSGTTWQNYTTSSTNNGSLNAQIPWVTSTKCLVKVSNTANLNSYDISDATFTIKVPVTLTTPNGGQVLKGCNSQLINFYAPPNINTYYSLYYTIDGGATYNNITTLSYSSSGSYSYSWSIPNSINSTQCKIKVESYSYASYLADSSDTYFTINPSNAITVTYPNGGEQIQSLTNKTITWTADATTSGSYSVYYSANGGVSYTTLISNTTAKSYVWTNIPNNPGTNYLIRVLDYNNSCKYDESDATFTVLEATPKMTYPNGGEIFNWGDGYTITWNKATYYSAVRIDYSTDSGTTWQNYTTSSTNNGSLNAQIPWVTSTKCLVKVSNTANLNSYDISDATFTIKVPVTLTTPNGGQVLKGCNSQLISFYAPPNINTYYNLYYTIDGGTTYTNITTLSYSSSGSYSYSWSIPNSINSTQCKIKVEAYSYASYLADSSDTYFTINPSNAITVTYPNGGEQIQSLTNKTITWTADATTSGSYSVYYSANGGISYTTLISNTTAKSYVWTNIPNNPGTNYLIRVLDYNNSCKYDESDATFTVLEATPKMTYPNGGEIFNWGDGYTITWNKATYYSAVRIDYSTDSGTTWQNYTTSSTNNGSLNAQIPWVTSTKCLVKVSNTANLNSYDISDATFTIKVPVTLTTPNGGQVLKGCNSQLINFYAPPNINTYYSLYYTIDGGATYNNITTLSYSSSGSYSYSWSIPNSINSTQCKIKVEAYSYASYLADSSDTYFTINPSNAITVTYPNGGEQIQSLTNKTITWTADATTSGSYSVYYSANGGVSYTTLISNTTAKSYVWTNIPNNPGTNYLIRVLDYNNSCKYDESDATFTVLEATPKILTPNGGEVYWGAQVQTITWNKANYYSPVRIDYSLDSGLTWLNITTSTTNSGSLNWFVPDARSTKCLVKVSNTANLNSYDISDAVFTINPVVRILTPNGGDSLGACTITSITFEKSPAYSSFDFYYSLDDGATYTNIAYNQNFTSTIGTYNWNIPNVNSNTVRVKVTPYNNNGYYDVSDNAVTIKKPVNIIQPYYGGTIQAGTVFPIKWKSDGISNLYDIAYSTNGGTSWTNIILGLNTSSNTYNWTVPNLINQNCIIRVRDNINSCKEDISGTAFIIKAAANVISVTYPNGQEVLNGCQNINIAWTETGTPIGNYDIYYTIDGAKTWTPIVQGYLTTTGKYNWTLPSNINSQKVLVKVYNSNNWAVYDQSDAAFTLQHISTSQTGNFGGCNSAVVFGTTYTNSTIVKDTLKNIYGCDSVFRNFTVTIQNITPATVSSNWFGCNNYVFNGKTYTTSTQIKDTVKTIFGCDSLYRINNISIQKITATTQNSSLFGCNSVTYKGITYTSSTTAKDTLKTTLGCDSIYKNITVTIQTINPTTATQNLFGCNSLVFKGITYTISSIIYDTLKTTKGCDSVYRTNNITIKNVITINTNDTIQGCGSVVFKTKTYTSPTTVLDTIKTIEGCDSIYRTVRLNVIVPVTPSVNVVPSANNICKGTLIAFTATATNGGTMATYNFFVNNVSVQNSSSNIYSSSTLNNKDTIKCVVTTSLSCVSTTTAISSNFIVAVKNNTSSATAIRKCADAMPITWNANSYNTTGNYIVHLTNAVGCDSAANLTLTVNALPIISLASASNCLSNANLTLTGASNALQIVWQNNGTTVNTTTPTAAAFGTTVAGGNPTSTLPNALNGPSSVFVDKNGVLYVGDLNNARIQRFAVGNLNATTVAGGYGIGIGLNQFNSPSGVMVDDSNNVYVGDFGNHRVTKWLPNATAGIVVAGGNGSTNTSNAFNGVADIFIDAANNIYVADQNNHRIQKWAVGATSGVTVAGGNGAGSNANQINLPTAVFVDAAGNVYVGDYGNKRVTKWAVGAASGVTVAGGNGAGAANNQIDLVSGIYVDAIGNVYVADQNNHRIAKWAVGATSGVTVAGGNGAGSANNQFKYPKDIYIDTAGAMYIPDNWNQRVQKWLQSINQNYTPTTAGNYTAIVTNNFGCNATTNVVTIATNVTPILAITASTTKVCANSKITFNANITNGGTTPSYQWKKNGDNVGTDNSIYNDSTLNANDSVWCVLTSNASCATNSTVKSNIIN